MRPEPKSNPDPLGEEPRKSGRGSLPIITSRASTASPLTKAVPGRINKQELIDGVVMTARSRNTPPAARAAEVVGGGTPAAAGH